MRRPQLSAEMMALARNGIEYPEGREEGWEEGFALEREPLVRRASRKLDDAVARRLGVLLAEAGATGVAEAGDSIIDCNTGEELIARVSDARGGR